MNYQEINAQTTDWWCMRGWPYGQPISHEEYEAAKGGAWDVCPTHNVPMPRRWLGDLKGKDVLGLASGGGQQIPIFSALGARCTVMDLSKSQIESELLVARREGYAVNAVRADMTQPFPFGDASFDIIYNPISHRYVRFVEPIFRECYRVLRPGGILVTAFDTYINFITWEDETRITNFLPFDPLVNEDHKRQLDEHDWGMQFSHTLTEEIGGQLAAGFQLTDLYEDTNNVGFLAEHNIPCYVATRSVKAARSPVPPG